MAKTKSPKLNVYQQKSVADFQYAFVTMQMLLHSSFVDDKLYQDAKRELADSVNNFLMAVYGNFNVTEDVSHS